MNWNLKTENTIIYMIVIQKIVERSCAFHVCQISYKREIVSY